MHQLKRSIVVEIISLLWIRNCPREYYTVETPQNVSDPMKIGKSIQNNGITVSLCWEE